MINDPNIRILLTSNTATNAGKNVHAIRSQWERNVVLRTIFPDLTPNPRCRWSDEVMEIPRSASWPEGTVESVGAGTQVISRHFNVIIEDDTVAPSLDDMKEGIAVPTKEACQKAIGWHLLVNGLAVTPGELIEVIVGTRWASYDIMAHILENENEDFDHFRLDAAVDGVPTFPERYPMSVLDEIKRQIGSYLYFTQYMNEPMDVENMLFRVSWVKYFSQRDIKNLRLNTVIIVDPASSDSNNADYNSIVVVSEDTNHNFYVREYVRTRENPKQVISHIIRLYNKYRQEVYTVSIEDVSYQRTLKFWLDERCKELKIPMWVTTHHNPNVKNIKTQHIASLQPYVESGMLYLPDDPTSKVITQELKDFPLGKTDDVIDAIAWGPKKLHAPHAEAKAQKIRDGYGEIDLLIDEAMTQNSDVALYDLQDLISVDAASEIADPILN